MKILLIYVSYLMPWLPKVACSLQIIHDVVNQDTLVISKFIIFFVSEIHLAFKVG